MGCCGQGRARAAASSSQASVVARGGGAAARRVQGGPPRPVTVRYAGGQPVRVRGAVTGRQYAFRVGDSQAVDAADVPCLVRTGLFTRA